MESATCAPSIVRSVTGDLPFDADAAIAPATRATTVPAIGRSSTRLGSIRRSALTSNSSGRRASAAWPSVPSRLKAAFRSAFAKSPKSCGSTCASEPETWNGR